MIVVCSVCRDVVHTSCGYILRHGSRVHGCLKPCSGSGVPVSGIIDCCYI